jgi:hypothetical protein
MSVITRFIQIIEAVNRTPDFFHVLTVAHKVLLGSFSAGKERGDYVALGGPNIYPGVLSWLGIARELTAGTGVLPAFTQPLDQGSFEPEDTPKFLQDKAIRGAMTDLFYETLGVESATFSFGGPNFLDTHGYFFDNVFGDLSTTCSSISGPQTTSTSVPVGGTAITIGTTPSSAGFTAGVYIQLGTALTSNTPACFVNEVVQVSGTAAANVVYFANTPARFAHPSVIPLNGVTNPGTVAGSTVASLCGTAANVTFTHRFAALNSQLGYGGAFGAQPPTHTFTDVTNIVNALTSSTYGTAATNTYGARWYPSAVCKNIDFSGNAEQLLGVKTAGDSFLSAPVPTGTAPTLNVTGARPIPNWNSTVTILDQGTVKTIGEFSVSFKRQTQVYWTVQGSQTPFVIARGPLTMDGTIQYDPTNTELPLDLMLLNAQGPMAITCSNSGIPNSGTPFTLTFTASQVANIKSKIMRSKALIGYSNTFEGVANSNDIGGSGALGPGVVTLVNNIPTY